MALAIPKDSLVLVTGATGYIGSWITYEFIARGYRVRAGIRSQEKGQILTKAIESSFGPSKVEISIIKDFAHPEGYAEAIKGVAAVVHVAADLSFGADMSVVENTVNSTKGLLDLAAKTPSVKRFTLTSSSVAISAPKPTETFTFSPLLWNTESLEKAPTANSPLVTYAASKYASEKAFWDFPADGHFVRNAVNPNMTIGPSLDAEKKLLTSTGGATRGMYHKDKQSIGFLTMLEPQYWVNVRDVAYLHVGATIFEEVQNKRLLGFTGKWDFNMFVDTMREFDPNRELPDKLDLPENKTSADNSEGLKVLKLLGRDDWIGYEETMRQNLLE